MEAMKVKLAVGVGFSYSDLPLLIAVVNFVEPHFRDFGSECQREMGSASEIPVVIVTHLHTRTVPGERLVADLGQDTTGGQYIVLDVDRVLSQSKETGRSAVKYSAMAKRSEPRIALGG